MNFRGMIKRGKAMDKAFEQLQEDVAHALDENMDDLDVSLSDADELPGESIAADQSLDQAETLPDEKLTPVAEEAKPDKGPKLTTHTQNRLEALKTFEGFYQGAQERLREMSAKLADVTTLHHSVQHVIDVLHAEIHRANDLELSNTQILAEHRKLFEQFQDSCTKHQEREYLLERLQQRETSLVQDNEALRTALAAAKMESVEAANTIARNATELVDLTKTLSAKSMDADRRAQENEALREKNVNLSIELDKTAKREADARHRLEEMSRVHASEAARHSELLAALAKSEKEVLRVQKALDIAQMKQTEMAERARIVEVERDAETARNLAEIQGLRAEVQSLQARLEEVSQQKNDLAAAAAELKVQLNDAVAERQVADERLAALAKESDADKADLVAANASLSELSLRQTSDQIQLDIRIQECEDLKAEIASLNAQIRDLLPYERLHRVTKARQLSAAGGAPEFAGVATEKVVPASRRPTAAARNRQARAIRLVE